MFPLWHGDGECREEPLRSLGPSPGNAWSAVIGDSGVPAQVRISTACELTAVLLHSPPSSSSSGRSASQ